VRRQWEEIEVKNGNVEALTHDEDLVLGYGCFPQGVGICLQSRVNQREMEAVLRKALNIAGQVQGR